MLNDPQSSDMSWCDTLFIDVIYMNLDFLNAHPGKKYSD